MMPEIQFLRDDAMTVDNDLNTEMLGPVTLTPFDLSHVRPREFVILTKNTGKHGVFGQEGAAF